MNPEIQVSLPVVGREPGSVDGGGCEVSRETDIWTRNQMAMQEAFLKGLNRQRGGAVMVCCRGRNG